ncbi:histidinol-phosphatase HisJ family protein [candidate division CSSED10-310 bacterium]|uniref:Histidinol-phosphatase n=1 Tax=candidate division CSSED10-310 bacterium TaxID=2855610 RepID=A0ABV6YXL8_UNCC1
MKKTPFKDITGQLVDYHIHTSLSDGRTNHHPYVKQAAKLGLSEIGFSDHICLKKVPWSIDLAKIPLMAETISELKKSAPLPIKFGVEMDFIPGYEDKIKSVLQAMPLDYVIGSVHFLDEWNFDSYNSISTYQEWDLKELYSQYFRLIQLSAESKLFDILGHIDLIKKFGFRPECDIGELFTETAEIISKNKVCIEVNTSGLIKPCQEIYPSSQLLKICCDYGIPITLGSDAHKPGCVGQYFDDALMLIQQIGYKKIAHFNERKRILKDIQ